MSEHERIGFMPRVDKIVVEETPTLLRQMVDILVEQRQYHKNEDTQTKRLLTQEMK